MDIKFYLSLFLRRIHYFLIPLVLGSAIGIALARILPPTYEAQALLVVESEQIPDSLAASTFQADAVQQLQIVRQRILSRDNLIDTARRMNVYGQNDGPPSARMSPDELVEDMRKRVVIETNAPNVTRRGDNPVVLITVGFSADTPQMAANVANEVVTMILRENVAMRTGATGQTLEFFTEEVKRRDKELSQIGAQILKFKQENFEALPDSLDFRRSRLAAQQERLRDVEREMSGLKDRRANLVRIFESTGQVDIGPVNRNLSPEERKLQDLRGELDSALITFSPQNPKIKVLEAQIAAQEKIVAQKSGGNANPGMSAYEIQLADLDGQISYLEQQKSDLTASMEEIERTIAATPANAITLAELQRNYDNVQQQYNQAVADKAKAETGDTIESMARGKRIAVIEQATTPREPSRPNRIMVAGLGVGGGLVLGAALVLLLEILNRSIRRPEDLIKGLGITPFATLPLMQDPRQSFWRRRKNPAT